MSSNIYEAAQAESAHLGRRNRPFSVGQSPREAVYDVYDSDPLLAGFALRRTDDFGKLALRAFTDRDPVAGAFGLDRDEHGLAPCPLAGHYGTAWLDLMPIPARNRHGLELRYVCNCLGAESAWAWKGDESVSAYDRHLADAYHALHTGRVLGRNDTLPEDQRAYWRTVLARDVGLIEALSLPELPADADADLHRGRDHFALISGRQLEATGSPVVAWARSMIARDLGITPRRARDVIAGLQAAGVIELDHKAPDRVGPRGVRRGVHYFRPGPTTEPQVWPDVR